ncbi:MAG: SpoIIE family protein phosphatase [Gemmatimonadota bacterium]|nr:SpoIIE family protein phosphatase [Gemmatimonadota bacterium]MDE3006239.1 SpoIIE family protein phosphatase [Gemmatimonadota bacterium]MDE3014567.1 SpoIIE family protein phosphatase [Gemmatimonadota bacterium]
MSESGRLVLGALPEPVLQTLEHFENAFGAVLRLIVPPTEPGAANEVLYQSSGDQAGTGTPVTTTVVPHLGPELQLQVLSARHAPIESVSEALTPALAQGFEATRDIQFFTYELSERFEEINLLYSISETLGSTLDMDSGASTILSEIRDVMGAKRGSLWVHESYDDALHLAAEVGDDGRSEPLNPDDPDTITAMVFREGRSIIASRQPTAAEREAGATADSFLSVPIRYSPGTGGSRTVGVINLIGRLDGGRFSAANQKLLAAIASQIGAAIENHRLVQESLSRERMSREMELAHDLQMKLLPAVETFEFAQAAGRVQPTEQVGGDFYQLFKLPGGRVGVMLGDVSLHGFPSALIMMLTMSAAGIYAREVESPALVLRKLDDALADELATTEMFLTVFYGVIDPAAGVLTYANAGHPHAFAVRADGETERLLATDPPVGFAGADSYSEESVTWASEDDLLLLFTDGLSDTLATKGLKNGETQVVDCAIRHRFRSPPEIIDELFQLSADVARSALADDRTALVVRG